MDVYPSMDSWRKQDMVKTSLLGVPHDDNSSFMKEGSLRISAANCNPRRAACGTKQASISARRAGLSLGGHPVRWHLRSLRSDQAGGGRRAGRRPSPHQPRRRSSSTGLRLKPCKLIHDHGYWDAKFGCCRWTSSPRHRRRPVDGDVAVGALDYRGALDLADLEKSKTRFGPATRSVPLV